MKSQRESSRLPKGWTAAQAKKLAEYYDKQSDEEGAAEIATAEAAETVMIVPTKLVARIRKLISENGTRKTPRTKSRVA